MPIEDANITPQDCGELAELFPAYTMGMTDADETALVERLLQVCPETETYDDLAAAMLFAVPQVDPPVHIADNLMRLTAPNATPERDTQVLPLSRYLPAIAGVAAAMIVVFGLVGYFIGEINTLRDDRRELLQQIDQRDAFLNQLGEDDVFQFVLDAEDGVPDEVSGVVVCNPDRTVAMIQVSNFPELDADMTYQAWLIRDEERISAGLFDVDSTGRATLIFTSPVPMGEFDFVGITPEPESGSEAPTSSPVVFGSLYAGR